VRIIVEEVALEQDFSPSFLGFPLQIIIPQVTAAERSKARTVFARADAGTVGSNPSQGMDV
jgi:hypothetical protein